MRFFDRCNFFLGNGYIPTSSLREILGALDDQLTPDQLNEMIAEIDSDSSGTVDFEGNKNYIFSSITFLYKIFNICNPFLFSFSEFMEMMTGD